MGYVHPHSMLMISKDAMVEYVTISNKYKVHKFAHGHWFNVDVGCVMNDIND